jgi:hypothetical protein
MGWYSRFWNAVIPLSAEEREESLARAAVLAEQARTINLANDRAEELMAREKAEQAATSIFQTVAIAEFHAHYGDEDKDEGNRRIYVTLLENHSTGNRKYDVEVFDWNQRNKTLVDIDAAGHFIKGQTNYKLFVKPWIEHALTTEELHRMPGIMIPGKIPDEGKEES